jgi:hypothetical protein
MRNLPTGISELDGRPKVDGVSEMNDAAAVSDIGPIRIFSAFHGGGRRRGAGISFPLRQRLFKQPRYSHRTAALISSGPLIEFG